MLQVYVDDSGKADQSPSLVLAGYLASVEEWNVFSEEWNAILQEFGLSNFHAAEFWRLGYRTGLRGPISRDVVFVRLIECIKRNLRKAFVNSIPFENHEYWFASKQFPEYRTLRIYHMAFYSLMTQIYMDTFKYNYDQPLEVIFDEQGGESQKFILQGMAEFGRLASVHFPGLKVALPRFESDTGLPGLQAADMLAWLVRRDAFNAINQIDRSEVADNMLLQQALDMPSVIKIWSEEELRLASYDVIERLRSGLGNDP